MRLVSFGSSENKCGFFLNFERKQGVNRLLQNHRNNENEEMSCVYRGSRRIEVALRKFRSDSRPKLIYIPGLAGTANSITAILEATGIPSLSISLAGRGATDRSLQGYGVDALASDISEVIKSLSIQEAVLLGFSAGAPIAASIIGNTDCTIRGVLFGDHLPQTSRLPVGWAHALASTAIASLVPLDVLEGIESCSQDLDYWPRLKQLNIAIGFATSSDATTLCPKEILTSFIHERPDIWHRIFLNTGHLIYKEDPLGFSKAIVDFYAYACAN